MSDLALLIPIAAITVGPIGWVANNWIRAKHGYPLEGKKGSIVRRDGDLTDDRRLALLTDENERLTGKVERLEERLAVLERIATDPASRTYAEIEELRRHA
jgi:hypothetical protein